MIRKLLAAMGIIALVGCGLQPQSAAPAASTHEVAVAIEKQEMRSAANMQAVKDDVGKKVENDGAATRKAFDEFKTAVASPSDVAAVGTKIREFQESVTNPLASLSNTAGATQANTERTNDTLEKLSSQVNTLRGEMAKVANVDNNVATLLEQFDEFKESIGSQPKATPARAAPSPPPDIPDGKGVANDLDGRHVRINLEGGESIMADEFIRRFYKGPRQFPIPDDPHLAQHGMAGAVPYLDDETKRKMLAAIHDRYDSLGIQSRAAPSPAIATQKQSATSQANCSNGQCRAPQSNMAIRSQVQPAKPRQFKRKV